MHLVSVVLRALHVLRGSDPFGREPMPPLRFQKILIADERYESAGVFDVNNDGVLDIVSGAYWYPGPHFDRKCKIGDGHGRRASTSTTSRPSRWTSTATATWTSSPAAGGATRSAGARTPGDPAKPWPEHIIAEIGNVETTRAWDVDGDGQLEIVPNTPGGPLRVYKLITDARRHGHRPVPRATPSTTASRATASASATSTATAAATSSWPTAGWRPPADPLDRQVDLPPGVRPGLGQRPGPRGRT